jgi:hypothetical protein
VAEQTAIIATADITGRLSTQAYTRLFAKNGGSTVDTTFRDLVIAETNSRIRTLTRAAFPSGLYTTTDTIDPEVIGRGVDIACMIAASRHTSAVDESGSYMAHGRAAEKFFREMSRDADARPPNSNASVGTARPRAGNTNITDDAGAYTMPYNRAADRRDASDF